MNVFRLLSLVISNNKISTDLIELVNTKSIANSDNYFSLIIGNNGTGKSRILSYIAQYFKKGEFPGISELHINYNSQPRKVIAITNSISDKFPIDDSYKFKNDYSSKWSHKELFYNYLGNRNRFHGFSNKSLMNKALEIVIENFYSLDISRNYRHIFKYLDYEPVIKIKCRLKRQATNRYSESNITDFLRSVFENKPEQNDLFEFKYKENFKNLIRDRQGEILRFIEEKFYGGNYEFTINFSEKNIHRIYENHSIYEANVYDFELINILRKLDLIATFEIQLFKFGGTPLSFSDASSGEAGILSTLLALIPIVEDNSLILIDEPEISLHPIWQSRYFELLNKILEHVRGCHIIIASHSPFLASNLNPNNSSVIALTSKKGIIQASDIETSTYGWSAEDILINVFKLQTTRNLDLYSTIKKALFMLSNQERDETEFKKLRNELISFYPNLLDNDPVKAIIRGIFEVE